MSRTKTYMLCPTLMMATNDQSQAVLDDSLRGTLGHQVCAQGGPSPSISTRPRLWSPRHFVKDFSYKNGYEKSTVVSLMKKGSRDAYKALSQQDRAWVDSGIRLHEFKVARQESTLLVFSSCQPIVCRNSKIVCEFITTVPITKLFAWPGGGERGGHVLRETTSRGLCGLVCPSRTCECGGGGDCVKEVSGG